MLVEQQEAQQGLRRQTLIVLLATLAGQNNHRSQLSLQDAGRKSLTSAVSMHFLAWFW